MKTGATVAVVSLFIVGVGTGILGTMILSDKPSPQPSETSDTISATEYKLLEDKLARTEATVATQKELLTANEDFLDALYEFELSLSMSSEPTQDGMNARVRVQELRVLVGAERSDPETIVKATEEVEEIAKSLRKQ